ncbi:MAG: hypothetical protein JWO46_295 [Nocardioidaceae bacterium]|nr:hypothetical protein [Nocardioidaceae bacterium]
MNQHLSRADPDDDVPDWLPPPAQRSGVAGVVRLAPDSVRPAPPSAVQGTLALDLGDLLMPDHPGLRLVRGAPEEARDFAARFTQGVVEVLGGDRHPHQLLRCTSSRVQDDLVRRATLLNAVARPEQRRRRLRAQVRTVHVQQQGEDAAEVAAVVRHGERCRALAARVELEAGRWVCVALELG